VARRDLVVAWMTVRWCDRWRELWHCGFGLLVDWGMVESPCGTPRPGGVVAVVALFVLSVELWLNPLVIPPP